MIEDWTEYHRNYYYLRRQRLIDYLGGKCVRCGRTDTLEFDHIDRSKKSFDIRDNLTLNPKVRAELDKCQLLCHDHHLEKTVREHLAAGFAHGTLYGWMKRHCPCDECETAKRTWYDARNERRRNEARANGATARAPYKTPAEHGEIRRYYRGCRCDKCRAANTARARARERG